MYQKNEAKAWKCEALNNTYINLVWLIVTLVIHRSGGVRQRLWSPDILTTGGCIKKNCMKH